MENTKQPAPLGQNDLLRGALNLTPVINRFIFFTLLLLAAGAVQVAWATPRIANTQYSEMDVPVYTFDAVADFGADKTGNTDASGPIIQALNAAEAAYGGIVYLPAGNYLIKNPLSIPRSVTLRGDWKRPTADDKTVKGTVLFIDHGNGSNGTPAITLGSSCSIRDLSIYYPNQNANNPVAYPWTILSESQDAPNIRNITLVNSYRGVCYVSGKNPIKSSQAHSIYGAPLYRGFHLDYDTGHPRLIDINFAPEYWGESGLDGTTTAQVRRAIRALSSIGLSLGATDGANAIVGLNISGYDIGLQQFSSHSGRMFDFSITDCRIGLDFLDSGGVGFNLTSGVVQADEKAVQMIMPSEYGSVQLNNVTFSSGADLVDQDGGVLGFTNCIFERWRRGYAIDASSNFISVNGCEFKQSNSHIRLNAGLRRAVVYANTFAGGVPDIVDNSGSPSSDIVINTTSTHNFVELDRMDYPFIHVQKQPPTPATGKSLIFNVRDFGAVGNGLNDDTQAFQSALDVADSYASASSGCTVFVPVGVFRIDGRLQVPSHVELRGIHDYRSLGHGAASILLLYAGKNSPGSGAIIKLAADSGIKGLYLYRPEQPFDQSIGATTVYPYPFAIEGTNRNWAYNMMLGNIYDGIDFSTGGGHHVEGLFACALNKVLEISGEGETSVVELFTTKNDLFTVGRNNIVVPEWETAYTAGGWRPPLDKNLLPGTYDTGVGIVTRGNGTIRFMGHFMNGTGQAAYQIYGSPTINMYCTGGELPDRDWAYGTYIDSDDDNVGMDIEIVGGTCNNDTGAGFTFSQTGVSDRLHRINSKSFPGSSDGHIFSGEGHIVLQQEYRIGNHDISLKLAGKTTGIMESGWFNGNRAHIANVAIVGSEAQVKVCGLMAKGSIMWLYNGANENQICVEAVAPDPISNISGDGGAYKGAFEVGEISHTRDTEAYDSFNFALPTWGRIVVVGPISANGSDPCHARVKNVTSVGFSNLVETWLYEDGAHAADETMSYMAVDRGVQSVLGLKLEADAVEASGSWKTVQFKQSFNNAPVVFAQVVSSDHGTKPLSHRINNVTTTSFQIKLQDEEAETGSIANETIHFIAIEPGAASDGSFKVGRTPWPIGINWDRIYFGGNFNNPYFIADMQSFRGADTADLRYKSLSSRNVRVKVEEEKSRDFETIHTTESIGWMVFSQ
jgi:hypothetical protein